MLVATVRFPVPGSALMDLDFRILVLFAFFVFLGRLRLFLFGAWLPFLDRLLVAALMMREKAFIWMHLSDMRICLVLLVFLL